MYLPEKIYTDNPFVDNVLYYCKMLVLNSVVKDESEALAYETKDSISAGDLMIACIDGNATFEQFPMVPKSIIEKYIAPKSNLDLYVENDRALEVHLNSYDVAKRIKITNSINSLARTVYIDHYDVMMHYLTNISDTWLEDKKDLYDKCINKTADYKDLFDEIPLETRKRIIKQYLNNYNQVDLADMMANLDAFEEYVNNRDDSNINIELSNITNAMCCVFLSHYETMVMRKYVTKDHNNWLKFTSSSVAFLKCKEGSATYAELYNLFPNDELYNCLIQVIPQNDVDNLQLDIDLDRLETYFDTYSSNPDEQKEQLSKIMITVYLKNYNSYMNYDIYTRCKNGTIGYFELKPYMPTETLKIILNAYMPEITNLEVFELNKNVLNEYLASIDASVAKEIKNNIVKDMMEWYPKNYQELNIYYRYLIGQPPISEITKDVCVDTLERTMHSNTGLYTEFGNRFISMIPNNIYPESHWKEPIWKMDAYDISILKESGVLDAYMNACKSSNTEDIPDRYRYFDFLGDNALNIYTCRKAKNFQLIGVPSIDDKDIRNKFIDSFVINRDYVLRTVYSEAYKFNSDYYDKFIIIFILLNTVMDLLSEIPRYIIDREVFDSRCIKYLFEANGIPYYSEIPIKYQRAMLKNLHFLIKFKSSTRNMVDICSLFGFNDVNVFNHYLFKSRPTNTKGEFILESEDLASYKIDDLYIKDPNGVLENYLGIKFSKLTDIPEYETNPLFIKTIVIKNDDGSTTTKSIMNTDIEWYIKDPYDNDYIAIKDIEYFKNINANTDPTELKFIRVPITESVTEYKNDPNYINNYKDIVTQDEGDTWHGGNDFGETKKDILDYEFNAVRSKYISIETVTGLAELSFQMSYFYNMLFDNLFSEDNLVMDIPYLKYNHKFRLVDVICYLFSLMYIYMGLNDKIMYSPTQIMYVKGYNFNEALNTIFADERYFQQTDEDTGDALIPHDRYNIFDINDRIAEDNYNYQDAFKYYKTVAFNLGLDIDELEKYMNEKFNISLSDLVTEETIDGLKKATCVREFFSLSNSYYQKNIFKANLLPLAFNNSLKYGFGYNIYDRKLIKDIDGNNHSFITVDDANMEVIDNSSEQLFIMDYYQYLTYKGINHVPYYRYTKDANGNYKKFRSQAFIRHDDTYSRLFDHDINIIRDKNQKCVFAADHFYKRENNEIVEITEDKHFMPDPYEKGKRILLMGEYYVLNNDNKWVLREDNCYVITIKNGVIKYVLLKDIGDIYNIVVPEDSCYILHSDGHFVNLMDTDYYRKGLDAASALELIYQEEELYIRTTEETEYFDPDNPDMHFMKLEDYYNKHNTAIISTVYYVKNPNGNFIPETELINPLNCYFLDEDNKYKLVINHMATYNDLIEPMISDHILILQENYVYSRLLIENYNDLIIDQEPNKVYLHNSDYDHILCMLTDKVYNDTNSMIVLLQSSVNGMTTIDEVTKYNPEVTDKVWDENDWVYNDPSYDPNNGIGMNGENKWYYKKPGGTENNQEEENAEKIPSGFYMEASAYIGDVEMEYGFRYHMAFDVTTNFKSKIQICCDADSECKEYTDRNYMVYKGVTTHISQTFTANANIRPTLKFFIYDYEEFPINIGDYIIISNIQFVKSHSDNFIAQDIPSFDKLAELFNTNEIIYKFIVKRLAECSKYRDYCIYKTLYDALMTSKYNKEVFKLNDSTYAKTYTDFIKTRDSILADKLEYFKTMDDETMKKEIADNIVEITYALGNYIDSDKFKYIYSYFPGISINYVQQYVMKVINFFKSWKVHLLGISTVYKLDSDLHNRVKVLHHLAQTSNCKYRGYVHIHDGVKIMPIDAVNPEGIKYTDKFPDMITVTTRIGDICRPRERVKVISRIGNIVRISENTDNMHIIFNSDDITVNTDNNELIISSDTDSFSEINNNEILMSTGENINDINSSQVIAEINHTTKDIFEQEDR